MFLHYCTRCKSLQIKADEIIGGKCEYACTGKNSAIPFRVRIANEEYTYSTYNPLTSEIEKIDGNDNEVAICSLALSPMEKKAILGMWRSFIKRRRLVFR